MKDIFIALILSALPISELRGGIPYGLSALPLTLENVLIVYTLCVMANLLIVLPLFIFLDFFHVHFLKLRWYKRIFGVVIRRIQRKSHELKPKLDKYGYIALSLFVAVPLPITGAWTGTVAAWLLDLDKRKSFIAISLGVVIAGIVITLASIGFINISRIFSF